MLKTLFIAFTLVFPFYYMDAVVTAYTPSIEECGKDDGLTSSGSPAVEGVTIACDGLPIGTVVEIDGQKFTVQDRFGHGLPNKIDIFMEDVNDALQFGRQLKLVKVYYQS